MKKVLLATGIYLLSLSSLFGLDASVSFATFKAGEQGYVEIFTHVVGSTVTFNLGPDSLYRSTVEVIVLFKQGEEIIKYDKYQLNSPASRRAVDYIDIKRYGLLDGTYTVEVSISDMQEPGNVQSYTSALNMAYNSEGLIVSDLQLLSSFKQAEEQGPFVKNNLELKPLPFNFYGKYADRLIFYTEVYQSDQAIGDDFLLSYMVNVLDGEEEPETILIGHKRKKPLPTNVVLLQMDITQIPSGNYQLVVEIRNRNNELLQRRSVDFVRSNPFLNVEEVVIDSTEVNEQFVADLDTKELEYSLRAIAPLIPNTDVETMNILVREEKVEAMRMYLFSFWVKQNPNRPDLAYQEYMKVARAVDATFKSGFGYGFETDRGYVFLKYGPPSDMFREENDPVAPPYEIWSYNYVELTRQNNARFIFYNPSLATGDFRLLHSTVRGELNNPQWEIELYRDAPNEIEGSNFIDATEMQDNLGREARSRVNDF